MVLIPAAASVLVVFTVKVEKALLAVSIIILAVLVFAVVAVVVLSVVI